MFLDIENGATKEYVSSFQHLIGCEVDIVDCGVGCHIFGVIAGHPRVGLRVASLPVSGTWSMGYVYLDEIKLITEHGRLVTYEEYMNIYYTQYDYKDGE